MNTPIEVMEHYYPIRFEAYKIREDSGGPGKWRGGMGIERTFVVEERVQITVLGDRSRISPSGFDEGLPGQPSEYHVLRMDGQRVQLKSKDAIVLEPGDTLVIRTAGGGGYGNPLKRDASLVKEDIADGYITAELGSKAYGQ
jgi:N-methylhydantoinase B